MLRQRTIREKVSCRGVGLHSGASIGLELLPAPVDSGISFVRSDLPAHPEIRPCIEHVADTTLATTLALPDAPQVSVGTVEHLLAAITGLGIDNLRIMVDGPEIPILDGSSLPFVRMLVAATIETQRQARRYLVVKKEIKVTAGDKTARLSPANRLRITCSLDFDHPLIPPAPYRFDFSERAFERDVAPARTFGFLSDVEALRARGLARGGSLDNAIVIDDYRVLNPEGLRFPNEFVRHKVLDALGDISLFGMPVVGRLHLHRTGHALNCKLVRVALADPRNYEVVVPAELESQPARGEANAFEFLDVVEGVVA